MQTVYIDCLHRLVSGNIISDVSQKNGNARLESKDYIKHLGGFLHKHLSWKFHIDTIASKISKTVGLIAKLRHFNTRCILLNIYQSLIYPYLTYGLASWGQSLKTHLNKILILQKRAPRMIFFADRRDHAIPFFVDANILPLSFLYYEYVSNFMHDINNNNAPLNILKLFQKTSSMHTYNTRSSTCGNLYVQSTRLEIHKRSFSRFGVNCGIRYRVACETYPKKEFKREIRRLLLDILEEENDHIETLIIWAWPK